MSFGEPIIDVIPCFASKYAKYKRHSRSRLGESIICKTSFGSAVNVLNILYSSMKNLCDKVTLSINFII